MYFIFDIHKDMYINDVYIIVRLYNYNGIVWILLKH